MTIAPIITPSPLSEAEAQAIHTRAEEIEALGGLTVLRIEVAPETLPRFFVTLTAPMHEVRIRLERELYDLGQQNNKDGLGFYVTKRVEKGPGWNK